MTGAQDKEELQKAMTNKVPAKIDIGPVYNVDPQRRKAYTGRKASSPCTLYILWISAAMPCMSPSSIT